MTVAQTAARELLRAIADQDPLTYRKATELAAAVLNLGQRAIEPIQKTRSSKTRAQRKGSK